MKLQLLNTVPSLFNDFEYLFGSTTQSDYFLDEDQKDFYLSLDMPGIKKEDLKIEIKGNKLVVEAESKGKKNRKYHRTFTVPNTIDLDNSEADLNNGVLTLKIPKVQEKTKLIHIK